MLQQKSFPINATAVTDEPVIGAYYTMTGYDDGDGIFTVRAADRPHLVGIAQAFRYCGIGYRLSERDLQQDVPDRFLKRCPFWSQREVERPAFAGEIFPKLLRRPVKKAGTVLLFVNRVHVDKIYGCQRSSLACDPQGAEG